MRLEPCLGLGAYDPGMKKPTLSHQRRGGGASHAGRGRPRPPWRAASSQHVQRAGSPATRRSRVSTGCRRASSTPSPASSSRRSATSLATPTLTGAGPAGPHPLRPTSVNGGISVFLCSNLGNGPAGTQPCPPGPATITGDDHGRPTSSARPGQGIAAGSSTSSCARSARAWRTPTSTARRSRPARSAVSWATSATTTRGSSPDHSVKRPGLGGDAQPGARPAPAACPLTGTGQRTRQRRVEQLQRREPAGQLQVLRGRQLQRGGDAPGPVERARQERARAPSRARQPQRLAGGLEAARAGQLHVHHVAGLGLHDPAHRARRADRLVGRDRRRHAPAHLAQLLEACGTAAPRTRGRAPRAPGCASTASSTDQARLASTRSAGHGPIASRTAATRSRRRAARP